ncbi:MAG: 4'-phosphopantetheinyl transferase family protein [Anaerovibrio sp.]
MVKVYIADTTRLADKELYRSLYKGLDAARRAKADYFLFEKDKRLSVAAGALLQHALRQENVWEPSFEVTSNGKPYLAGLTGAEGLYFNLSHSEGMVMCAISEQEVGCDVEKKAVLDRSLAEHVMQGHELDWIYGSDREPEQQERFFRLWTLKESYMKATGLGMSLEPRSFGMHVGENGLVAVPSVDEREFHFQEYFPAGGYCYACCSLSEDFCDILIEVDLGSI